MRMTRKVKQILSWYESDSPGTKTNLARILMQGKLAGTGKMVILPVDQGFEHGPDRSFAPNPPAYDPHYHFQLAIDAGENPGESREDVALGALVEGEQVGQTLLDGHPLQLPVDGRGVDDAVGRLDQLYAVHGAVATDRTLPGMTPHLEDDRGAGAAGDQALYAVATRVEDATEGPRVGIEGELGAIDMQAHVLPLDGAYHQQLGLVRRVVLVVGPLWDRTPVALGIAGLLGVDVELDPLVVPQQHPTSEHEPTVALDHVDLVGAARSPRASASS